MRAFGFRVDSKSGSLSGGRLGSIWAVLTPFSDPRTEKMFAIRRRDLHNDRAFI
jgi:hypothetical protein